MRFPGPFLSLSLSMLASVTMPAHAQETKSVWDGVYTSAQAARGEAVYSAECARCHRDDLAGYNGALVGGRFMDRWREDTLESFYNLTRNSMPRNAPGSLSDAAYLDVVAYILKFNKFPAGEQELTAEGIRTTRVQGKEGPAAVPDFSLVTVVGCLSQASDGTWVVTNASEPVRTRNPGNSTPEELKSLASKPLGKHTFSLMDPSSVQAAPPKSHKVEAKGFLIRKPGADSMNPTSLQSVAPSCTP